MPVPAVHEKVHQRAGEKRQLDENTPEMSAVLGQQERAGDDDETEQRQPDVRSEKTSLRLVSMPGVIVE
jgi:hypothetical protein